MLQVHLYLICFIGGLAKFLGNGWWDGSNLFGARWSARHLTWARRISVVFW